MSSTSKIKVNPDALKPRKEWKRHKVEEGDNIFRFLPPYGESSNGYPYRRWMVIWGLLDPDSGRVRPYASPITTSEKACPVMEYTKALGEKAERIKSEMKQKGASEEDIKERLKPLNKVISNLRPKGVYAWNAVDKSGKIGLLELKSTAHKKLKQLMNDYLNDYEQDPTSVNSEDDDSGVWFNIKRSGKGFDTEYDVEKVQHKQKVNGQLVFTDDRSPLPDDVVGSWQDHAYDLSSIYQVKTYDEIKDVLMANMPRIIEECPDALIEGFEPDQNQVAVANSDNSDVSEAKEEASATSNDEKSKGKKTITTKFDDGDDEGDDSGKSTSSNKNDSSGDDDIFSLADDILNS